jgi:hypothetical protein
MSDFTVNLTNSTDTIFHLRCYDNTGNLTQCLSDLSDSEIFLMQSLTSNPLSFLDTISHITFAALDLANPVIVFYTAPDQNDPACITPESEFSGRYSFATSYSEGTCNFAISYKTPK